nr:hypothetical protein [Tanacetum cinerariifolium]
MSAMANTTPIVTTVTKPAINPGREKRRDTRMLYPELTSRISVKNTTRTSCQSLWNRFAMTSEKKSMLERLKVRDRLIYNYRNMLDRLGHRRQNAFDRLRKTYSPSVTKSRPNRTSPKDRSRNRSRPHRRDSSNGDRLRVKNALVVSRNHMTTHIPPIGTTMDIAIATETALAQKKYIKDPIEIHNIKQKDGEIIEDFMEQFKVETESTKGAPNPNASSSGNKKKSVKHTIKVSNSNPFDVLNSVDNDVEFGTNRGTTNLVNNRATSSGSSFMNIDNDGQFACNTPIGEKIDKIERQICEGKIRLSDNDKNFLVSTGIVESDSEVEVVFDETDNLRISTSGKDGSKKGYGINSLLEQWRDSYQDNDDYDPYDDDI